MSKNPDGIWAFDSYSYWQNAYNLFHHGIFSQSYKGTLQPDYFRTPIYPLFLLPFINSSGGAGIVFFQIILSSLSSLLIALAAFELFKNSRLALIAGLILALDIPSIVFSQLVLTETLFVFLLCVYLYLFILYFTRKRISFLLIGAFVHGLLLLCRPVALFTLAFPLLILLFHYPSVKAKAKYAIIYILVFLFSLLPWLIRNKMQFDHYFISTIGSSVLLNYHAASIVSEKENIPFNLAQTQLRLQAVNEFTGDAVKEPVAFAKVNRQNAFAIIAENKTIFVKQHLGGVFSILFKPVRGYIDNLLGYTKGYHSASASSFPINKYTVRIVKQLSSPISLSLVIYQLVFLGIIYLGFLRGIFIWRQQYNLILLGFFLLLIFYFANITLPPFNEARFRLPLMPFIAIISALGLNKLKVKQV